MCCMLRRSHLTSSFPTSPYFSDIGSNQRVISISRRRVRQNQRDRGEHLGGGAHRVKSTYCCLRNSFGGFLQLA